MVAANDAYRAIYWQRAHLAYYTRRTLGALLARAGFELLEVRYVQRYGLGNFMHWQVMNEPQLAAPDYGGVNGHDWLEHHYRQELIERGQADTLVAIAALGGNGRT